MMTMNLIVDPWIPAVLANGQSELFSLNELFNRAHELRDLAVKPHERIALMRLLICITQAALEGPKDEQAWEECGTLIQPCVKAYLKRWKGSFELFGQGQRFLQAPDLTSEKSSEGGNPATKVDLSLATGNNSVLFDNCASDLRISPLARAALNLLTFQCFSPGGRIGVARWAYKETPGKGSSNHAPCLPSCMIHSLVLGETLLETIKSNLLNQQTISDCYPAGFGKPIWEQPVLRAEDQTAVRNATLTYLGRLVPLSRAIRLHEDGATILLANGLDYPIFPAFRESSATIIRRKGGKEGQEELGLLPGSTARSLWRQLSAITVKRKSDQDAVAGPLALSNPSKGDIKLWVGALITDKAKIEDNVEGCYCLPKGMLTEFGRVAYEQGVQHAEERESDLIQAVKHYSATLKIVPPAYDRARQSFWTRVEQHVSALFDVARNQTSKEALRDCPWGKAVAGAISDAYESSCPRQTPRQIQAYALGLSKLNSKPIKSKKNNHE